MLGKKDYKMEACLATQVSLRLAWKTREVWHQKKGRGVDGVLSGRNLTDHAQDPQNSSSASHKTTGSLKT